MISIESFYGDAHGQAFTVLAYDLTPTRARLFCLRPSGAGLYVQMADPDKFEPRMKPGGPMLSIWNTDATNGFTVKDHNGVLLGTVAPDEIARVYLGLDAGEYVWGFRSDPRLT